MVNRKQMQKYIMKEVMDRKLYYGERHNGFTLILCIKMGAPKRGRLISTFK